MRDSDTFAGKESKTSEEECELKTKPFSQHLRKLSNNPEIKWGVFYPYISKKYHLKNAFTNQETQFHSPKIPPGFSLHLQSFRNRHNFVSKFSHFFRIFPQLGFRTHNKIFFQTKGRVCRNWIPLHFSFSANSKQNWAFEWPSFFPKSIFPDQGTIVFILSDL